MTKPELVDALAERTGMKKKDAELFLNAFMDVVTETVKSGEPVVLVGLVSLCCAKEKPEKASTQRPVNPSTFQPRRPWYSNPVKSFVTKES